MKTSDPEELSRAVEKALGEPVAPELSANAWKIRTNLLVVSVIAIGVVLADLRIDPSSTVLGLRFSGFTDSVLRNGLLLILCYLTVHFLWTALDGFLEWKLRVTGTRLSYVTAGNYTSEHADHPSDPRQSTLYRWWISEAKRVGNLRTRLPKLEESLKTLEQDLRARCNAGVDAMNIVNVCRPLDEVRDLLTELSRSVEQAEKTMGAVRISVSLRRFDSSFALFLRSQNLRWLLIDILMPLVVASYAIFLLWI